MRIAATPLLASEGRQLASELLAIVSRETRTRAEAETPETGSPRPAVPPRPGSPPRPDSPPGPDSPPAAETSQRAETP